MLCPCCRRRPRNRQQEAAENPSQDLAGRRARTTPIRNPATALAKQRPDPESRRAPRPPCAPSPRRQARRFLLRALALDAPHPDVAAALHHHGYVQIDPINVCGRMHDHPAAARRRVSRGRPHAASARCRHAAPGGGAHRLRRRICPTPASWWPCPSKPGRTCRAVHACPDAHRSSAPGPVASPRANMKSPRACSMRSANAARSARLISTTAAAPTARSGVRRAWSVHPPELFFHGRLLIAARDGNRRRYDLPGRVLPPATLAAPNPPPPRPPAGSRC